MDILDLPDELQDIINNHCMPHIKLINKYYNTLNCYTTVDIIDIYNTTLLEYYFAKGMIFDTRLCLKAIELNNVCYFDCFIKQIKLLYYETYLKHAIKYNRFRILSILYKFRISDRFHYYAVELGNLRCLKYCFKKGFIQSYHICLRAAMFGNLKCLKYAHKKNCPWDESVCACAARGGYLQCLIYAYTNGCSWDMSTCTNAVVSNSRIVGENTSAYTLDITNEQKKCLIYAYTNGCPCPEFLIKLHKLKKLNN